MGPNAFASLRRTFSGHFHVHQTLDHNVVYVGSPLQFNCTPNSNLQLIMYVVGDAGNDRGIVIYDIVNDTFEYKVNPHCHSFIKIKDDQLDNIEKEPEK